MTTTTRLPVPPAALAVAAMLCVQVGGALSTGLFARVGPAGTAWLRLTVAALVLLAVVRPRPSRLPRAAVLTSLQLGGVSCLMTVAFFEAIARLPLGTAVAIEFLGPLAVAVVLRGGARSATAWPALALVGVLCLTRPWAGGADAGGVLLALVAAAGWGAYIVLTQRVGDALPGLTGLSLSLPVAALGAAVVGVPQAAGHLTAVVVAQAAGLALLLPLVPYALEVVALRRLTTGAFGTLMSLEPAVSVLVGLVVLHQVPRPVQVLGIGLVVTAGLGAQLVGGRRAAGSSPAGAPPKQVRAMCVSAPADGREDLGSLRSRPAPPVPAR